MLMVNKAKADRIRTRLQAKAVDGKLNDSNALEIKTGGKGRVSIRHNGIEFAVDTS